MSIRHTRTLLAALLLGALAGCGGAQPATDQAPKSAEPKTEAVAAAAPHEIEELTDQKKIWECPKCGMMFDGPGQCEMDKGTLVETSVAYICPADEKPVDKAGRCPRCAMNARVVKTAIAAAEPAASPATTGN